MMSLFMFLLSSPEIAGTIKRKIIKCILNLIPLTTHLMVVEKDPVEDTLQVVHRYALIKNKVCYVGYLKKENDDEIVTSYPLYSLKDKQMKEFRNVMVMAMISFEQAWHNYLHSQTIEA